MKRTTLALDEDSLRLLKRRAAEQGTTLQAVVNDALRQATAAPRRGKFKLRLRGWSAQLQAGVDLTDRDKLFDLMDGRYSMIAVDTNILVYAEITSSEHHEVALARARALTKGATRWALPWPCVYEFLRIVTHPRVYHPPVPPAIARADMARFLASPSLVLLSETARHAEVLDAVLTESGVTGNLVYDAHIVALCREHGVREILTADGDFRRLSGIKITNPFA
jgi:hypothetical protein